MTAPTMSPDLDERTKEELAPPCDILVGTDPCPRAAEWVAVTRCCGDVKLMCDYHREMILRRILDEGQLWFDTTCGTTRQRGNPYVSLERL